jgi:hypothetical protein
MIVALLAVGPGRAAAQRWSPDGRWLAYTVQARPRLDGPNETLAWLLPGYVEAAAPQVGNARATRLWATRVESGESVLLAESDGPITEPSWSRDGASLAFGRWLHPAGTAGRFELVMQDTPQQRRVVRAWPITGDDATDVLQDVALAPDGACIAAPLPDGRGLILVRSDDGAELARLPNATRPRWDLTGQRLAFVEHDVHGGTAALRVFDARSGRLLDISASLPGFDGRLDGPRWSRDEQALWYAVVSDTGSGGGGAPGNATFGLERLRLDGRDAPPPLFREPLSGRGTLIAAAFDFDAEQEAVFYAVTIEGKPTVLTWLRGGGEVFKRYPPLHELLPIRSVAVSPRPGPGRLVALRVGPPGLGLTPATSDPDSEEFTPLVPDADSRAAWASALLDATALAVDALPGVEGSSWAELRPTRLPLPGDLEPTYPGQARLARLARLGRRLCNGGRWPEPAASEPSGRLDPALDGARLVFDALLGDADAALGRLEAVQSATDSADARLRLLGLRAQLEMTRRRWYRAHATLDFLADATPVEEATIESTPLGPEPVPDVAPLAPAWLEPLRGRLDQLRDAETRPQLIAGPSIHFLDPPEPAPFLAPPPQPAMPPPDPVAPR